MSELMASFLMLLVYDAIWVVIALALVVLVAQFALPDRGKALMAVFRRNFSGYFINPAGYVFLMLFVLISSAVGFWPDEFFNQNLANLGQLNKYLPIVLLFFIPSITMNIWADERRQGTDELLLTLPASDWSIVAGKYIAAAGFFSASLLFSQISNFWVLNLLSQGGVDVGLFFATYLGYWAIGLAMLAVGMVASFLTNSLTVAFILGVVFNAPLVLAEVAKAMPNERIASAISRWSFGEQFADFGRGVISLRSVTFFTMLIVVGLYLSLALIGRRHWSGGRDGKSMLGHYIIRAISLVLIAVGVNLTFAQRDHRYDATTEKISSLSPETTQLIRDLKSDQPILIEAFISGDIPKSYAKTRVDLESMVREIQAQGGSKVSVRLFENLDSAHPEAVRAEQQYGIRPVTLRVEEDGALKQIELIMGIAFTSGLEKVVVPFIDRGIPVEYELVRSLVTVASEKRLKVGVLRTDAQLFGGVDMQQFTQIPKQLIVQELEKQYEVVEVDPNAPIDTNLQVLLAVQPSSLTQPQLNNLVNAIRDGVPTALFEDPYPYMMPNTPGTGQPKRPQGGGMFMGMGGQPPEDKGDVQQLWSMLGVSMIGQPGFGTFDADIVWQKYNPYPKISELSDQITEEWVFASPVAPGAIDALSNESEITSRLSQLLLLYPGAIQESATSSLKFTPLVTTGNNTGTLKTEAASSAMQMGTPVDAGQRNRQSKRYVLAARIQGKVKAEAPPLTTKPTSLLAQADTAAGGAGPSGNTPAGNTPAGNTPAGNAPAGNTPAANTPAGASGPAAAQAKASGAADTGEKEVDVVFVTDVDLLSSAFLQLRANPQEEFNLDFDNVTFVLNIIDSLAKEDRFLEIRKRKIYHSSLRLVEDQRALAESEAADSIKKFQDQFKDAKAKAEKERNEAVAELNKQVEQLRTRAQSERRGVSRELQEALMRLQIRDQLAQQRLDNDLQRHQRDLDRELKAIRRDVARKVDRVRSRYRLLAGLIPPLPPLIVGLLVHWYRQRREQEGIADSRRR